MAKIAVDAVLLPSEAMMKKTIEANKELLKKSDNKIVLDKKTCLPHISLAMGCIDEKDICEIEGILQTIASQCHLPRLKVVAINIGTNSVGEKVSVFQIENDETLQSLHEEVMRKLTPYFKYDVTVDMVLSPPRAEPSTLLWIKNYRNNAGFENFFPHITIGYGQINPLLSPIDFTASKLALCHLGNNCTCRKILISAELKA